MGILWSQFFPPAPPLTEGNLPRQDGKVFIVTGGYSGVGLELARILYYAGAKVYIAGRSEEKYYEALKDIKVGTGEAVGELQFLHLELDDLTSIKASVEDFRSRESKVDVLWNNAAVSLPPGKPTSKEGKSGHELTLVTNLLGPFLFTNLLLPCLEAAAAESPSASTRVVWTSSVVVDGHSIKGAYPTSDLAKGSKDNQIRYCHTKLGNWYLAHELGERVQDKGILSITQNPGNLRTNLLRHFSPFFAALITPIYYGLLYPAKYGAYTELYTGLSPDLGMDDSGKYIIPWGRMHPAPREDLMAGMKSEEEGGTGLAKEMWEFCEQETSKF